MKPIKIVQENAAQIEAALEAVNGRARTHTFRHFVSIESLAQRAENDLEAFGVTKANRKGATFYATSGGYLPNRYDNKAIQTAVTLERGSSHWYLVEIHREALYPRQNAKRHLTVTQEHADEACKRLLATVTVKRPVQQSVAA
jgi:tRNA G26 N,N-dimethylase Trm1